MEIELELALSFIFEFYVRQEYFKNTLKILFLVKITYLKNF